MMCRCTVDPENVMAYLSFYESSSYSEDLHAMEKNITLHFTSCIDVVKGLKSALADYVAGHGKPVEITDYYLNFELLKPENHRVILEPLCEALLESAKGLMDMKLKGYISDAENALEIFNLKADNLLLQLEVLELREKAEKTTQTTEKEEYNPGNFDALAESVQKLNERYLGQEDLGKALETLVEERIGELKRVNRELEDMNKKLSSFAYISSHDLQEPLRKIQTFGSLILENEHANLSESGKKNFARMQFAASKMSKLIRDLLDYSRANIIDNTFETVDIKALLHDIESDFSDLLYEKHAVLLIGDMPTVKGVPFQLRQLFNNLISNALKFAKEDIPPVVSITSAMVKGSDIDNSKASPEATYAHIAVSDNGIGFSPENASRIFEVFQRLHGKTEYEGTGIGLAICMKIAENHGAIMNAASQPGKGATFNIYFPVN